MSDIQEVMNKISFYSKSSARFRKQVDDQAEYRRIPRGTLLFNEGDACSSIGLLAKVTSGFQRRLCP